MKAMKDEFLLFTGIAVFVALCTIGYSFATANQASGEGVEITGAVCLALTSGMFAIVGSYLYNTARRYDRRPEDKPTAAIEEGSGTIGHFSPGSYWPVGMALGGSLALVGFAFGLWVTLIGASIMLFFVSGLLLEHYRGEKLEMIELVEHGHVDMTPGSGSH